MQKSVPVTHETAERLSVRYGEGLVVVDQTPSV
jgi:hypothetical protein